MEHIGDYKMRLGEKAMDFNLLATDGKKYKLSDFKGDILVIFFTCNHCPYARAYENRIIMLAKEFKGIVDFVAINSNEDINYPQDSYKNMVERYKERSFNFTYLRDETQAVARAYGGECTPHFFVFDVERKLRYQGRLDDSWENPEFVEKTELRDAIVALLEGEDVPQPITPAIGCSIKWKKPLIEA